MECLMVFNCRKGNTLEVANCTYTCSGYNPTIKEIYEVSNKLKDEHGYDSVVVTNVIPLDYEVIIQTASNKED